jgi:DNA (cytosine-5)-methyltransferase 1
MRHGSLFSGIGGFDLAASWMGWENVFQCEKEPFCRRVLRYYWPKAELYEDVRSFEGEQYRGNIDVFSGGFPCQPFSTAGKRKGTGDDRYLWPEMYRIVRAIRPRWVVGENVFGLLNWGRGMVFEQVQADLEAEGYEVWSFVLPAAGVGAPHRRDRIWIVAHTGSEQRKSQIEPERGEPKQKGQSVWREPAADGRRVLIADADGIECQTGHPVQGREGISAFTDGFGFDVANSDGPGGFKRRLHQVASSLAAENAGARGPWVNWKAWENFPVEPPVCARNDGVPAGLDGITFPKWRDGSIKGAGNAIVPQVAWELFKVIEQMEKRRE